jgi:cytochrome P450
MEENVPVMNFMAAVPILSKIMRIPTVQRAALPTVKDRVGMGRIKAVTSDIIARRFGDEKEVKNDITQSFIAHGLDEGQICDESLLQILAGSDTTATIIRSGFIQIISNAQVMSKLQAECDASGVPLTEIISNARAIELPYLNACVKEALRFHPAATGTMPRKVGPEGDWHKGMYFPPGTEIGFCAWNVYKLNPAYGGDADVFRPDRWIEATPEQLATMEKSHDLVFGYGKYRCMGEKIARIELLKTFFELMRRFNLSFLDPMKPLEKDLNYGLFIQKGMWLRVEERKV